VEVHQSRSHHASRQAFATRKTGRLTDAKNTLVNF
jgi:hypothetical protein